MFLEILLPVLAEKVLKMCGSIGRSHEKVKTKAFSQK
jgi:hypothetical protein